MSGAPPSSTRTRAADAQERVHLIGSNGMGPAPAGGNCNHINRSNPTAAAAARGTAATVVPVQPVRIPATYILHVPEGSSGQLSNA